MDHSQVRYFINTILNKSLIESMIDHRLLAMSIIKTIIFCNQIGILKISINMNGIYSNGIAKNIISDFFGLIK